MTVTPLNRLDDPGNPVPHAGVSRKDEKARLRAAISDKGLGGAANDTKWNALIDAMRRRTNQGDWVPSYRHQSVRDGHISGWDVEWFYHLPFPMMCAQWLDIGLHQEVRRGRLVKPDIIDHSSWILPLLDEIGFEYEVSGDVARIFGYLPKSYEDFPPA